MSAGEYCCDGIVMPESSSADCGLVAYYKFNGDGSDSSVNSNTCSFVGNAYSDGSYLITDGSADYANCGHDSSLSSATFTVSHWVKSPYAPSSNKMEQTIKKLAQGGDYSNYEFNWDHTRSGYRQSISYRGSGTTWRAVAIGTPLQANTWYHLTGSYDGSTLRIYLNGSLSNSSFFGDSPMQGNLDLWLGSGPRYSSRNDFAGTIEEVRINNRALSDTEICNVCNQNPPAGASCNC